MSWNHRLLAHEHKGEIYLRFHEVHYDENGKPIGCTYNPIPVGGESVKSCRWTLNRMKEALQKPILWYGDRFPEEYQPNQE